MSNGIRGVIVNYRVGPKIQRSKECLVQFTHIRTPWEANRLIGRKVVWICGEKKIIGKILDLHGKKGLVRVRFRKGLPGQALGSTVELIG